MINVSGVPFIGQKVKRRYRARTKPTKKSATSLSHQAEAIVGLRASGLTLQQIGDRYGVSREYIRLILKANGVTGLRDRPAKPHRIKNFKVVMLRWLRWARYTPCRICHVLFCTSDFSKCGQENHLNAVCRECGNANTRKMYRTSEKYRAQLREHNRKAKECGYFREYVQRPEVKARRAERFRQMKADPVLYAAHLEQWRVRNREAYHKRKAARAALTDSKQPNDTREANV